MRNPFWKITETRIGTRKYTDHSATNLELPVNMHAFGLLEEARVTGEIPRRQKNIHSY